MLKRHIFPKSEFAKNAATLVSGAAIAQAIPIAVSPILSRIYTPEDFGVLALFISIVSIISVVASGRYELAILVPKEDDDAINVAALSLVIITSFSLLLLIISVLFNNRIAILLENDSISLWLYFIPLVVFLTGSYNILRYLGIRFKDFKDIALSRTLKSVVSSSVKIILGFAGLGISGLMTGEIFSNFTGNGALLRNVLKKKDILKKITVVKIKEQALKYSDFPKYSLWSTLSNSLAINLNSIFMNSFFSTFVLGQYSMIQKIVGLPLNLIGQSISDVYFQKASEERRTHGNAKNAFVKTAMFLIVMGVPVFFILYFTGEELFSFVFGEAWRPSGHYAKILAFLMTMRFIAVPLSITMSAFEKQKYNLIITLFQLLIMIMLFLISSLLMLDIDSFLTLFSRAMFFFYFLVFLLSYKIALKGDGN